VKRLLFLGHTGTGKSSTINALTGSKLLTSDHTDPCTSEIAVASCKLGEHYIDCIDTPGFGDRRLSDVQVLRMVQNRLKQDHRKDRRIHAVFYLINISTPRKDAALATDINVFLKLVGDGQEADDVWKNVCFIYTHGVDPNSTGKGIARQLSSQATRLEDFTKDLGPQLKKGARTCHLIEDTDEEAESYIQEGLFFFNSHLTSKLTGDSEANCTHHARVPGRTPFAMYKRDERTRHARRRYECGRGIDKYYLPSQ
jgi:hypothetical protein